jgi:hypothetical protein
LIDVVGGHTRSGSVGRKGPPLREIPRVCKENAIALH